MRTEYKDGEVFVDFEADTDQYVCKELIGKKIKQIEARKESFKIIFSDESSIKLSRSYADYLSINYTTVSDKEEK